nr:hypothetical protein CFP56_68662 [Quercus suber]
MARTTPGSVGHIFLAAKRSLSRQVHWTLLLCRRAEREHGHIQLIVVVTMVQSSFVIRSRVQHDCNADVTVSGDGPRIQFKKTVRNRKTPRCRAQSIVPRKAGHCHSLSTTRVSRCEPYALCNVPPTSTLPSLGRRRRLEAGSKGVESLHHSWVVSWTKRESFAMNVQAALGSEKLGWQCAFCETQRGL